MTHELSNKLLRHYSSEEVNQAIFLSLIIWWKDKLQINSRNISIVFFFIESLLILCLKLKSQSKCLINCKIEKTVILIFSTFYTSVFKHQDIGNLWSPELPIQTFIKRTKPRQTGLIDSYRYQFHSNQTDTQHSRILVLGSCLQLDPIKC